MAGRLQDKVAIVVGGGTGFGKATVRRFTEEGAHVVLAARRLEVIEAVADEFGGTTTRCDVTDNDSVQELVATTLERHGNLDIAISYAGYSARLSIRDMTPEELVPMVEVQFNGAMYFMQHTCNAMAASGGGSFINISSTTAQRPVVGHMVYASAKAGMEYATQVAALDYGPDQVRVNCIAPHLIETEMTAELFEQKLPIEAIRRQTPLGRMGTPDDIAQCAVFLASDESGYISGQTIVVDGANSTQKLPTASDYEDLGRLRPELLE